MSLGNTTGAMLCAYCGRPAATLIWIGGAGYHEECTRGPGFQAPTYQPLPPAPGCIPRQQLTEEDVRRIVRDELRGYNLSGLVRCGG